MLKLMWLESLVFAFVAIAAPKTACSGMLISLNDNFASVYDSSNEPSISDSFGSTSFPTHHLVNATVGSSYSRIQLDYTESSGGTTLSSDLRQNKTGAPGDFSFATSFTSFSVTEDTTYNLAGSFHVHDTTTSGRVHFFIQLYDATNGLTLFTDWQDSRNTVNESFVAGGAGGDTLNDSFGSLSGNLVQGNSYQFSWTAYLESYPDINGLTGSASAEGNFRLTLGQGAAAVPEPACILIWSLSAVGAVVAKHRRARRLA